MERESIFWDESWQAWTAPPELLGPVPRQVALSAAGKGTGFLAALILAGAIAFYVFLLGQSARQAGLRTALRSGGMETYGTVTRQWMTSGKGSHPMVAYEFEYRGREYHGSSSAPRREWRRLAERSPISIRFLPDRPELNHPSGWEVDVLPVWMAPLMALTWSIGGIILVTVLRRQMRLLRDGVPAPGRVTKHRSTRGGTMLVYLFRLADGSVVEGRGGASRNPPVIGSEITVLYDPRQPKRNSPYPIKTVRVNAWGAPAR